MGKAVNLSPVFGPLLRILAMYGANTAKISNFQIFWSITLSINDGLLAECPECPEYADFVVFLPHT